MLNNYEYKETITFDESDVKRFAQYIHDEYREGKYDSIETLIQTIFEEANQIEPARELPEFKFD